VRVTGLREIGRDRVAVEVDGRPWRDLPSGAIVRADVRLGVELDRPRLRTLARELRRQDALKHATRRLRRRDLTVRRLDAELERRGVAAGARADALAVLGRAGLLDDARVAEARATALAGRGLGNAAIRWDLERQGVGAELAELAIDGLEDERERAERIVRVRGIGVTTARFLARKGFSEEVVEAAAGAEE
jgi:SOS response regulatory protein OraA/RecX